MLYSIEARLQLSYPLHPLLFAHDFEALVTKGFKDHRALITIHNQPPATAPFGGTR